MKKLSAEYVQLTLKRKGKEITIEEAERVLVFVRRMADIIVKNHLQKGIQKMPKDS